MLPLVALFMAVTISFGVLLSMLQFAGNQFLATRMYADRKAGGLWLGPRTQAAAAARGARLGRPVVVLLLGLAALAAGVGYFLLARLDVREDVAVTAHRGASLRAPENSMAAFREAYEAGTTFVELDVQRTRDGAIVVIHDGDLLRMAGDPRKVRDLTLAEIQAHRHRREARPAVRGRARADARRGHRLCARQVPHQCRAQVQRARPAAGARPWYRCCARSASSTRS